MLNATERGRQKRTMADIRALATATEAYAVDNNLYPSSKGQWVEASALSSELSPTYIRNLPSTDGWGNPLLYWSNSEVYRIVSPGKDGQVSAEWSGTVESQPTTTFDSDIVFGDGVFLIYPEGVQTH
jgi:general secretion pathway protein G